jgi:tRNA pseudouridine38-40 synthase
MPPMDRNIQLVLAYDGTGFHGWQRQENVRTVQEEVQRVLQRVLKHPVHVQGASRTDAGVHARGQVAHFATSANIPERNLVHAIGHRLPPDIAILHARRVHPAFHASRDALGKLYRYRIHNAPHRPVAGPNHRQTWHVWFTLDLDRLRAAARLIVGQHDFAGFASQGSPRATTVRNVTALAIRRQHETILVDVEGDGFLYNQVRNIVGTLVEIGRGHWNPERIHDILASGDRRMAGPTAPPEGLCLQWVRYGPTPPGPAAHPAPDRGSETDLDERDSP